MTTAPTTGPRGYEQQYRVTAWLALLFDAPSLRVFVERRGEEDFSLHLTPAGRARVLDVQVKSSLESLNIAAFVEILATFPPRQAHDCLLERLRRDASNEGIVVVSGRARDDIDPLVVIPELLIRPDRTESPMPRKQARVLLERLAQTYAKRTTDLARSRHQRCTDLARDIDVDELCEIARRIFVIERMDESAVVQQTVNLLQRQHRIPVAVAQQVADPILRRVVENGRDSGGDIMPELRRTLGEYQAEAIAPRRPYLERGCEERLTRNLALHRVLLLTGFPWCGKTQVAHAVAQRMQDLGWHVRKWGSTADAERFLLEPARGEQRLALLEDPLGINDLAKNAADEWDRMRGLVPPLPHRALLVTSRADLLQQFHGSADPASWQLSGVEWDTIPFSEAAFGACVWRAWCEDAPLGREVVDRVAQMLERAGDGLELGPGHVRELASRDAEFLRTATLEELVRSARRDAERIGRELCRDAATRDTLTAAALMASTLGGPREEDLAYVLGSAIEAPGRRERFDRLAAFPGYPHSDGLSDTVRAVLAGLETRGAMEWRAGRVAFSHPFWERAAEVALTDGGHLAHRRLDTLVRRALACLDADSAQRVIAVVARLRRRVPESEAQALGSALLSGVDSIFPRVASDALIALVEGPDLRTSTEEVERVLEAVAATLPAPDSLRWENGRAWIAGSRTEDWMHLARDTPGLPGAIAEVQSADMPSLDAMLTVLSHKGSQASVPLEKLQTALAAPEPMVRARAGYVIAKFHATTSGGAMLVGRALNDPHPHVVAETLVGVARSWSDLDAVTQLELRNQVERRTERPAIALVVLERLLSFRQFAGWNDDWYHGRSAPWDFWTACATAALSRFPAAWRTDTAKLYDLAGTAIEHVPLSDSVMLLEAWLGWLERRVNVALPDDYGSAVAELLLRATNDGTDDTTARAAAFARLIDQRDTGLAAMFLRDLVRDWAQLSAAERTDILALLRAPRPDLRWLRAVVMVSGDPPAEVQAAVVDHEDALAMSPDAVDLRWPTQLIADCVLVFTGHPQPLWFIGTHHRNPAFWQPLLVHLALTERADTFRPVLREIVARANEVYGDCWRTLCRDASPARAQMMFEALLFRTLSDTHAALREHWRELVASPGATKLRKAWALEVARLAAGISYRKNLELLFALPEVLDHLLVERRLMALVAEADREGLAREDAWSLFARSFDEETLASAQTLWPLFFLQDIPKGLLTQGQRDALERRVDELVELGHRQISERDDHYDLPDWIDLARRH